MLKDLSKHAQENNIALPVITVGYEFGCYVVTLSYNNAVTSSEHRNLFDAINLASIDIANYLSIGG